ncbi:TAXI family TRAP transporter solute-binding subunit [Actinokineospora globicatena]|uniref:TAXI family TRAP transporter solute-binding subunit n=1 Tax=Actinokineospora globicatena TaxID=103729 RepID=UPI0020A32C31|nr:TAXI family TRAP transporter solute-binding subunit [Actinokineospora globicatena]
MARGGGARRTTAVLAVVVLALLAGCETQFPAVRLRIAAGNKSGVYNTISQYMAGVWQARLGTEQLEVLATGGSPDNVNKLLSGEVDIAFSAADVASKPTAGPRSPRALARIHDDYLHVVVRDDGPVQQLSDLRGLRVGIGAKDSGVEFIAKRVLALTGLDSPGMLTQRSLDLASSVDALKRGEIDAFFWSGGLPTQAISGLGDVLPIRLLDLADDIPALRKQYPVYNSASIPASTYHLAGRPVNTLAVPNFLLVTDQMSDDLAEGLIREFFAALPELAKQTPAALSIDLQSAIETDPLKLHPGAERFYRGEKI